MGKDITNWAEVPTFHVNYWDFSLLIARKAFLRTFRAYFARPDLLTADHDTQMYELGRQLGHLAIARNRDLAPGEPLRY